MRLGISAATLGFAFLCASPVNATPAADELVRQAHAHETANEPDLALRRYTDALALDATEGDAYLGLAELRMRLGEPREAEQVYSTALEHVPSLAAALAGRAHARRALGKPDLAAADLATFAMTTSDDAAWQELAQWYEDDGRFPAELQVWRTLLADAEHRGASALAATARKQVRALVVLVRPIDPAASPPSDDPTRAALARIAKRGG